MTLGLPAPLVAASTQAQMDPAVAWQISVARPVAAALSGDLVAYSAAMLPLSYWAERKAMTKIAGDARIIFPRRWCGAAMAWMHLKPIARQLGDRRMWGLDQWVKARAVDMIEIFGTGGNAPSVFNWNNNLQATAAMASYAAGVASGDERIKAWAISSAKEVIDAFDPDGFTMEITRSVNLDHGPSWALYYSHETMIFLVALARMMSADGDGSLWSYKGGMSKAVALLDADAGGAGNYARKTGKAQDNMGASVLPWLLVWVPAAADRFEIPNLSSQYRSGFNPTVTVFP